MTDCVAVVLQVVLALQSGQTSTTSTINIPDVIFNSVFLFELFVKVVGLGFWGTGKSAYLKNSWNISDLCILIGSVAGMCGVSYVCVVLQMFFNTSNNNHVLYSYALQRRLWTHFHQTAS